MDLLIIRTGPQNTKLTHFLKHIPVSVSYDLLFILGPGLDRQHHGSLGLIWLFQFHSFTLLLIITLRARVKLKLG